MDVDYESDLVAKLARNSELWEILAPHAINGATFSLEFFFYADSKPNSQRLQHELKSLDYRVTVERQGTFRNRLWAVIGSTPPITLTRPVVDEWTGQMLEVARRCESMFDGWGTELPS